MAYCRLVTEAEVGSSQAWMAQSECRWFLLRIDWECRDRGCCVGPLDDVKLTAWKVIFDAFDVEETEALACKEGISLAAE